MDDPYGSSRGTHNYPSPNAARSHTHSAANPCPKVAPGPIDPRRCVVEGRGPSPLRLHAPAVFVVHASDAWGNRCASEGERWSARVRQPLSSATATPQVKLRGTADGACEGTFTPVARGRHTLAVLLGGRPLSGGEIVMDVR